jgi:hypothetical protein
MPTASGTFDITGGSEDAYREGDGEVRLTRARGEQRFSGDIQGDGSVEWLMCYEPSGDARFVGLQRIEGRLGERRGSLVIEASGNHHGGRSKGSWRVIPGSGTGQLAGISGEGGFEAPGGPTASYRLDYEIG